MSLRLMCIIGAALACSLHPGQALAAQGEPDFKVAVVGNFPGWSTIPASHQDWIEFTYYRTFAQMVEGTPGGAAPIPLTEYLESVKELGLAMADFSLRIEDSERCQRAVSGPLGNAKTDFSKIPVAILPERTPFPFDVSNYFASTFPGGTGPQSVVMFYPLWTRLTDRKMQSLLYAHEAGHFFGNAAASMHIGSKFGPDKFINGTMYEGRWTSNANDPNREKNEKLYNLSIKQACGY